MDWISWVGWIVGWLVASFLIALLFGAFVKAGQPESQSENHD